MAKKNFKGMGADLFLTDAPETVATEISMRELKINPAFKALIPPLSSEEYMQLEENLIENGIREAISLWGDTIIDGHNRYEIAQKHGLQYKTINYDFNSEDDVKLWIFKNQIGRRNLPAHIRIQLALHLKPVIAEAAKKQQIRKSADSVQQISAEQTPIDTRNVIANMAGVSHDTVSKVEKILEAGTPDILEKFQSGEISINKAYQDVKRQEKRDEIVPTIMPPKLITSSDSKFDVILCDCPWKSDIEYIKMLEIPAADNAILFMWAIAPILKKAIEVMSEWGFEYRTCAVWDKQVASTGQYLRSQHELLLIGVKGKYPAPPSDMQVSSLYSEKLGKHLKKPDYYYRMIEDMCPDGTYLEIFSNKKYNSKWTVWSNHISEERIKE